MWLTFYNPDHVGDVLLLTNAPVGEHGVIHETRGNITLISDRETKNLIGINIFEISSLIEIKETGQIFLTDQEIEVINQLLSTKDIAPLSDVVQESQFVVGYVEECEKHQDSDHLMVTQTRVSEDEVLQIVCGASNIARGLKVLVAKVGAVMPSGSIIWAGELRGVKSEGMICSTRELNLTHIEDYPGIWELKDDLKVGTPLNEVIKSY